MRSLTWLNWRQLRSEDNGEFPGEAIAVKLEEVEDPLTSAVTF